ncbi:MAG TPA: SIS domain-containing protein [Mycobacteriales bacterium]|nr:SIS domain-containing protein [Mycobacteriales bacterium]
MTGEQMLAEMDEQPTVIAELVARWPEVTAATRALVPKDLAGTTLVARGSSDNAAVFGRYLIELASGRPAALAAPSLATRYGARTDYRGWLGVALSQSGATPEVVTVAAAMRAQGAVTIGISNERDCPLAEAVDLLVPLDAGPERAVPATKTVTSQLVAVAMIAAGLGRTPYTLPDFEAAHFAVAEVLDDWGPVQRLAARWAGSERLFVVGRGLLYAAALEIALKIKETTGVLAEALSAADLRHGPVAAVGPGTPVLLVDGGGQVAADIAELADVLAARGADLMTLGAGPAADISVPGSLPEAVQAVPATVRGQQLAYALATARGMDPDRPAGLSKITATT